MSTDRPDRWETDISGDGGWWKPWNWRVTHTYPDYHSETRIGYSRTKEKARHAAVRAQLAMGREDVHLVEEIEA